MNELELTGRSRSHIVELEGFSCHLHYEVVASYLAMRDAALAEGIELQIRSSFRDFSTQALIWNRKWRGERPLISRSGATLDRAKIDDADMLDVILAWSAVPGGSRHHWGTDLDVIDACVVPQGYAVQLVSAEYAADGIFSRLSVWLEAHMRRFGFFRPYRTDRSGVCPEPWHLSYAPVSVPALEALSLAVLRRALADAELEGKPYILARLPEIYTRYLLAIDSPQG